MPKIKILFNIINTIFIIFYIYPGSILGFLIYGDLNRQPKLTIDYVVSSNHVYAFMLLTLLGLLAYYKKKKIFILNYLILCSIILELLHLVIPNRTFQYGDLFGNIAGVLLSFLLFYMYYYWKKK